MTRGPLDAEVRASQMRSLVREIGLHGHPVLGVPHAGGTLDVLTTIDTEEVERRSRHGLGAVCDGLVLEALASLPLETPVPAVLIDPLRRMAIDGGPAGLVEIGGDCYLRRWRPACEATATFTFAVPTGWLRALELVSTTVGLADRYLMLQSTPPASLLERAARVGVGVVQCTGPGDADLLAPPASRARRLGVRRWAFLEGVYGRWLALTEAETRPSGLREDRRSRPSVPPASQRH